VSFPSFVTLEERQSYIRFDEDLPANTRTHWQLRCVFLSFLCITGATHIALSGTHAWSAVFIGGGQ
jgi:hypothetical protein